MKQIYVCVVLKKYGEDRLFTTAMAVNALITTWTTFDETDKKLRWGNGTLLF